MNDREFVSEAEEFEIRDRTIGTGIPATAPHEIPFDDSPLLVDVDEFGAADDGDDDAIDDADTAMLLTIEEDV